MAMEIKGSFDNYIKAENTGMSQRMDDVSKGIQTEITGKQRALRSLSENAEMSNEEKKKKEQEISQEIEELKNQLRQYQLEKRREEQEKAKEARGKQQESMGEAGQTSKLEAASMTDNSMQAMISADAGMNKAELEGNIAAKMENQASILRSEIQQDAARGKGTKEKEAKLAKIEKRVSQIASSQMTTMKEAKKDIKMAGEYSSEKMDNRKPAYKKPENNTMKNIPGIEYKQDGKKASNRFFHSSLDIKG